VNADVEVRLVLLAFFEAGHCGGQVFAEQGDVEHGGILGGRTLAEGGRLTMPADRVGVARRVNREKPEAVRRP